MNIEQRYDLIATKVTLDGRPARICGAKCQFAVVRALDGSTGDFQWAWETVAHVVANGGRFRS